MHKIGMNSSEIPALSGGGSEWAKEMQMHFARTGSYRPEDLQRVLGDPLQGVSAPTRPRAGEDKGLQRST
jgi:hypothetical protein